MKLKEKKIIEIEKSILSIKEIDQDYPNSLYISEMEKQQDYDTQLERIDNWQFIQIANYHYFVSRILFMNFLNTYALFCGQQCIENYLKAYLKFHNSDFPKTHNLQKLLNKCRDLSHTIEPFILSDYIETISRRFNPFNEVARYPLQNWGPKGRSYMSMFPTDLEWLDYFVFRMREILTIPENTLDILRDQNFPPLNPFNSEPSDFHTTFRLDNINFL